jgi:uncharacterized heparinase superfamily protein
LLKTLSAKATAGNLTLCRSASAIGSSGRLRVILLSNSRLESLALQARYLAETVEYHLLGNHLLANAKALVFVGAFFEGGARRRAGSASGLRILASQLPEQVLDDGGHFERSPMYHSLILEDVLDLVNLHRSLARLAPGLE